MNCLTKHSNHWTKIIAYVMGNMGSFTARKLFFILFFCHPKVYRAEGILLEGDGHHPALMFSFDVSLPLLALSSQETILISEDVMSTLQNLVYPTATDLLSDESFTSFCYYLSTVLEVKHSPQEIC